MQNNMHDLFDIIFSRSTRYDTISIYDTTMIFLIMTCSDTSDFYMHGCIILVIVGVT
jgi:hypothetical protein